MRVKLRENVLAVEIEDRSFKGDTSTRDVTIAERFSFYGLLMDVLSREIHSLSP